MTIYVVWPGESLTAVLAKLQPGDVLYVRSGKYKDKR